MRLHEIPRHRLTFGPSPLQHLPRLSAHLGGAQVWAKREDVNSGLAFGGNKIRKLEYIVPDVLASGAAESPCTRRTATSFFGSNPIASAVSRCSVPGETTEVERSPA